MLLSCSNFLQQRGISARIYFDSQAKRNKSLSHDFSPRLCLQTDGRQNFSGYYMAPWYGVESRNSSRLPLDWWYSDLGGSVLAQPLSPRYKSL